MIGKFNPGLRKTGVGTTLFGQFLSKEKLSGSITIVGLSILILGYFISYIIYTKK